MSYAKGDRVWFHNDCTVHLGQRGTVLGRPTRGGQDHLGNLHYIVRPDGAPSGVYVADTQFTYLSVVDMLGDLA